MPSETFVLLQPYNYTIFEFKPVRKPKKYLKSNRSRTIRPRH